MTEVIAPPKQSQSAIWSNSVSRARNSKWPTAQLFIKKVITICAWLKVIFKFKMNTQVKGTLKTDWPTQNLYFYTACNTSLTAVAFTNMRSFIFRIVKPLFYLVKKNFSNKRNVFCETWKRHKVQLKATSTVTEKLKLSFCVPRLKRLITERTGHFQRKGPLHPARTPGKNMIVNEIAAIVIK